MGRASLSFAKRLSTTQANKMPKATVNGTVIAESDSCEKVEGNYYFPPDSIKSEHFSNTDHTTVCGWKGTASYYTVTVGDKTISNGAWYYPTPKDAANNIKNYVAFYTSK